MVILPVSPHSLIQCTIGRLNFRFATININPREARALTWSSRLQRSVTHSLSSLTVCFIASAQHLFGWFLLSQTISVCLCVFPVFFFGLGFFLVFYTGNLCQSGRSSACLALLSASTRADVTMVDNNKKDTKVSFSEEDAAALLEKYLAYFP